MKPIVRLNMLAGSVANAAAVVAAAQGKALIGVMVKNYAATELAIAAVLELQQAGIPVSVGLGAGDPTQWRTVVDVAVATKPEHVNQVFPAAGFTLAALKAAGGSGTLVNALISPSGTPGKVIITTGPNSQKFREAVSCEAAAAMLSEVGVRSVKFYPIDGIARLEEVSTMVKAAVQEGITVFEPTGGIDAETLPRIVEKCAECGAEQIIPHIYTSIIDKQTGLTRISDVTMLVDSLAAHSWL